MPLHSGRSVLPCCQRALEPCSANPSQSQTQSLEISSSRTERRSQISLMRAQGLSGRLTPLSDTQAHCRNIRRAQSKRAKLQTTELRSLPAQATQAAVRPEAELPGLTPLLDSLKWDDRGLITAIVQVQSRYSH